jgi:hypothetical protein
MAGLPRTSLASSSRLTFSHPHLLKMGSRAVPARVREVGMVGAWSRKCPSPPTCLISVLRRNQDPHTPQQPMCWLTGHQGPCPSLSCSPPPVVSVQAPFQWEPCLPALTSSAQMVTNLPGVSAQQYPSGAVAPALVPVIPPRDGGKGPCPQLHTVTGQWLAQHWVLWSRGWPQDVVMWQVLPSELLSGQSLHRICSWKIKVSALLISGGAHGPTPMEDPWMKPPVGSTDSLLFICCLFILLVCWVGVHCGIYKSSYNV